MRPRITCIRNPARVCQAGSSSVLCIARALAVEPEVLLMDEPCSALDPISTGKIEELIFQLKERYTIVIVTHNMQQAARVAEFTGFFLLGKMIEFDKNRENFHQALRQKDGRLHHRKIRIRQIGSRIRKGSDNAHALSTRARRSTATVASHGRTGGAGRGPRSPGLR